jgi:hypothetical protein
VNAASMAFKKALIERAMGAELGHHLGYPAGTAKPGRGPTSAMARAPRPCSPAKVRAHRSPARPRRQLRAHPDSQARAALHRL